MRQKVAIAHIEVGERGCAARSLDLSPQVFLNCLI
jgi:hypothetical protein